MNAQTVTVQVKLDFGPLLESLDGLIGALTDMRDRLEAEREIELGA